jgi:Kdo2-lipid IVA lauroyltransferase/acyltransferase
MAFPPWCPRTMVVMSAGNAVNRARWVRPLVNAAAYAPYAMAELSSRVLPRAWVERLACAIARVAFELDPPARRSLERNLAGILPRAPRADLRRHAREAFRHFALAFVDFLRLPRLSAPALREAIEVHGLEHFEAARASGRGVIVISAHAGNWEWGAAYLADHGARVHVVARPHGSRWVERFFARRRAAWGVHALRDRPLWAAASRALRRREWVALMGDRPAPGIRGSLCAWASALARRTGAVILPAAMVRLEDGRYRTWFAPPLDAESLENGGYREAMIRHVREWPDHWFAFEPLPEGLR